MAKSKIVGIVAVLLIIAVLSLVFWLDDYTGIGEVLNFFEFLFLGVASFYSGKLLSKRK